MNRATAPRYDLFKLIVTLTLVVILVFMLLRGCATTPASPLPTEVGSGTEPPQESASPVPTEAIAATSGVEENTPAPEPSAMATTEAPATPESDSATPTAEPVTETPESTATEPAAANGTPTSDSTSCNTSVPSRLSVGQEARVVQRLNMRIAANILATILQTNRIGAQVEIIGGPVCQPVGDSAYLWWQVRVASGAEGWSAESPLNEAIYLMEPIQ
ncbi:MAG TPA: hypothetical protein VK897_12370 [Anaerolineales bacterium]|nr:hypothetical protein [Anaerolineales bacterium]